MFKRIIHSIVTSLLFTNICLAAEPNVAQIIINNEVDKPNVAALPHHPAVDNIVSNISEYIPTPVPVKLSNATIRAKVVDGAILLNPTLLNEINAEQLKFILLHEYGHINLGHVEIMKRLGRTVEGMPIAYQLDALKRMSYQQELEADRYAFKWGKNMGMSRLLIENVLNTFIEDTKATETSIETHPSKQTRIDMLNKQWDMF